MIKRHKLILIIASLILICTPAKSQRKDFVSIKSKITDKPPLWPNKLIELYDTIRITFIGDVMQHGKQIKSALIAKQDPSNPKSYDYSNVFRFIEDKLKKADLAVANMEFPMGILPFSGYPQFSAPPSIAYQAQQSGIGLFLLANNHLLDKGEQGLKKTLNIYRDLGTPYTGAYENSQMEIENNPVYFNIKNTKIAIINFTYGTNGFKIPEPYVINLMDSTKVKDAIKRAKDNKADIIIAAPHWGQEYEIKPSSMQKQWANILFNNGVNIIIGSHPHVPQQAEIYQDKIIFYSLGNYISNQSIPDYSQLELMVTIKYQVSLYSKNIRLLEPEYEFLWCFKKGEYINDYTVVPVNKLLKEQEQLKDNKQYIRMLNTYNYILKQNLIKKMY